MQLPNAVKSQEYSNRIPDGTYQVVTSRFYIVPDTKGKGRIYMNVDMIIVGGEYDSKTITDRFCIGGPTECQQEITIGMNRLGSLGHACGIPAEQTFTETDLITNKRCTATLKTKEGSEGRTNQNFYYKAPETPAPVETGRPRIQPGEYTPPQQSPASPQQGYTYTSNPSWGK